MLFFIWSAVLLAVLYFYFDHVYSRFRKYGVKGPRPVYLLGSSPSVLLMKEHMAENLLRLYNTYSNERFYGQFEFMRPVVVIRDLELVKKITVKDFDNFMDHRSFLDEKTDPIFGRNLVTLNGQEWREMRSALSPAFTSSKIRLMVPLMVEVGTQMMESLKQKIKDSNNDYIDIEAKDLTTRYANDVIASCAFGLKINSTTDNNNIFYKMGREITKFGTLMIFKLFILVCMPFLAKILKMKFLNEKLTNFFKSIILDTMREREEQNIFRPDMIHLLMEAKKGRLVHENSGHDIDAGFATVEESTDKAKPLKIDWSDNDLVAQAVLFLLAGFDTVSTAMSFALYELAVNPDVQEKLLEEIRENDKKNGGKFDYKSIQNMEYMDMVVSESLRLWPPGGALDRMCVKDYNLGKQNEQSTEDFYVRKGDGMFIPVWAFHRDPKYFPNPLKFDPERFSEENKHKILPFSYLPFGSGPRNCIGSRFALCEVKVMLYQLLQNFELSPCEKTCIPPELSKGTFTFQLKGGHWMRMKIRP